MDNLPTTPTKEFEDQVKATVDYWLRRKQLICLAYLYRVCGVQIADIPHEIRKAERAEIEEKKRAAT